MDAVLRFFADDVTLTVMIIGALLSFVVGGLLALFGDRKYGFRFILLGLGLLGALFITNLVFAL
jgi:hypothetical protein